MVDGYFVNQVENVEMMAGVTRRTLGTTDEAMMCEFRMRKGAIVPEHSHMNDQVGYVVSGKVEMTIGSETTIMTTGESYAIPGGVMHGLVILEDTVLIDAFSPPRNDYRTEAR